MMPDKQQSGKTWHSMVDQNSVHRLQVKRVQMASKSLLDYNFKEMKNI
jgi:hypothetical protein